MQKKFELQMMKNWVKSELRALFPNIEGSIVAYNNKTDSWRIQVRLLIDIPNGLEKVNQGFNEDRKKEGVVSYMKENQQEVARLMKLSFKAVETQPDILDFNFAAPVSPLFSVVRDNSKWRYLTEAEMKPLREASDVFRLGFDLDRKVVEEGYYQLDEDADTDIDVEAFVLRKYSVLRGNYIFNVEGSNLMKCWSESQKQLHSA